MVFTILSSPCCCEQYLLIDELMAHQPTHQSENNYFGHLWRVYAVPEVLGSTWTSLQGGGEDLCGHNLPRNDE